MALSDYQSLVTKLHRASTSEISTADRDEAIGLAVLRYSKDRPRVLVADLTPAGQYVDLPENWIDDFSEVRSIETPLGEVPPGLLLPTDFGLYQSPDGVQILLAGIVAAGQVVRVSYTVRHVLDAETDTISPNDREALSSWAAAILLEQLSSMYSGDRQSTIPSDSVDHQSKGRDYAARARQLRQAYFDALGIDPKRAVPAVAVAELTVTNSLGGPRLTHPIRTRSGVR